MLLAVLALLAFLVSWWVVSQDQASLSSACASVEKSKDGRFAF